MLLKHLTSAVDSSIEARKAACNVPELVLLLVSQARHFGEENQACRDPVQPISAKSYTLVAVGTLGHLVPPKAPAKVLEEHSSPKFSYPQ